tara:strand:- start:20497 stop:20760 length:264 start_codon:yes stop_codon:yes gene_type:complete
MADLEAFEQCIPVSEPMRHVTDAAVLRAQYLFPDAVIEYANSAINVRAKSADELRELAQQVRYTLYREHCARRDASLRELMSQALFR